jgi:chitodextrinase
VVFKDTSSNEPTSWSWSFGDGGTSDAQHPSHPYTGVGTFTASLTATNAGGSDTSTQDITVTSANHAPVADAGPDQLLQVVGSTVYLNGLQSFDIDGDPLTYQWTLLSRPSGSTAALNGADTATPTFIADKNGDYTVKLIVNDGYVDSTPATVTVRSKELTVSVDIEPGLCPNLIGLNMKGPLLVVAIPGTKDFDAKKIDPASIRLSRSDGVGGTVKPSLNVVLDIATPYMGTACSCQRKLGDGTKDLMLVFDIGQVVTQLQLKGVAGKTVPFTVRGTLKAEYGTTPIAGSDCVKVLSICNDRIRQGV